MIKAGLENITKIGGNYYDNVNKIKLQKMREDQGMVAMPVEDDFNNDTDINSFEEINDQMN